MAGEWPVVRLGDVVDFVTGFPFESQQYTNDPTAPRLLRGDNVGQGVLRWDGAKRWPATGTGDLAGYWLREGDVILAMDRPWIEAGLKYAAVRDSDLPALLVQRVARLRGTAQLHTGFLKYVIGGRAFTEYITGVQTGTAVPHISGGQIRSYEFPLPPLPQQRAIAHILGTLDDKSELNRRTNETLEAIARALFTSWFVDFLPVRAKAEGRDSGLPPYLADLFPDSLEDSELGEIPKGWPLVSLGTLCRRVAIGPFGSDITTDNYVDSGVPVVRGRNLATGFVDDEFVFVSETKADELHNANAFPGDIVITHRGTLGQVGLIPTHSRYPRYVVSQSQMLLSVDTDQATPRYVLELLRSEGGQHALLANTSQTGVPAIARPTSNRPCVLPAASRPSYGAKGSSDLGDADPRRTSRVTTAKTHFWAADCDGGGRL
jgi:type I restriction enzyme S subunit